MADWNFNSVDEHQEYSAELDKLEKLKLDVVKLQQEIIPQKRQEYEVLKRKNIEDESVSWQQVEEARQELERANYKLKVYREKVEKQNRITEEIKDKAREEINSAAREEMLKTLEKGLKGYEMMMEAHNELNQIKSKQIQALKLSSGEKRTYRNSKVMPIHIPHPFRESLNDLWYKRAKSYLEKNA